MLHLLYKSTGGRSGHKLKDIISIFIIGMLLDHSSNNSTQVVYHQSFENQPLIYFKPFCVPKLEKYDQWITIKQTKSSIGISYEQFGAIRDRIIKAQKNTTGKRMKDIVVHFTERCRIQPYTLHNWYLEGKIKENLFKTRFLPWLNQVYYHDKPLYSPNVANQIAIHVRRGDVAENRIGAGFDYDYYRNMIEQLQKLRPPLPISVYSELDSSEDLLPLADMPGVNLFLGDDSQINEHFHALCQSRILVLSNSSFSTWAAYLSQGLVVYRQGRIKHFDHRETPTNFLPFNEINLSAIQALLTDR